MTSVLASILSKDISQFVRAQEMAQWARTLADMSVGTWPQIPALHIVSQAWLLIVTPALRHSLAASLALGSGREPV